VSAGPRPGAGQQGATARSVPIRTTGLEEAGMHLDAVFWGSIISVVIAVVIFIYLGFKVVKLMNEDAERHKNGEQQN
jgi:hypothetical protein